MHTALTVKVNSSILNIRDRRRKKWTDLFEQHSPFIDTTEPIHPVLAKLAPVVTARQRRAVSVTVAGSVRPIRKTALAFYAVV
jgi:hypothetical protein